MPFCGMFVPSSGNCTATRARPHMLLFYCVGGNRLLKPQPQYRDHCSTNSNRRRKTLHSHSPSHLTPKNSFSRKRHPCQSESRNLQRSASRMSCSNQRVVGNDRACQCSCRHFPNTGHGVGNGRACQCSCRHFPNTGHGVGNGRACQ